MDKFVNWTGICVGNCYITVYRTILSFILSNDMICELSLYTIYKYFVQFRHIFIVIRLLCPSLLVGLSCFIRIYCDDPLFQKIYTSVARRCW